MELLLAPGIAYLIYLGLRVLYNLSIGARELFGREPERSEGDQNTNQPE